MTKKTPSTTHVSRPTDPTPIQYQRMIDAMTRASRAVHAETPGSHEAAVAQAVRSTLINTYRDLFGYELAERIQTIVYAEANNAGSVTA